MRTSYEQLIHEHDEIDAMARRLEEEIAKPDQDIHAVAELLADLSLAVSDHLSSEDRSVYTPLIKATLTSPAPAEVDFEAAFQALRADWVAYLADWRDPENVACDWRTFARDTRDMMRWLRQRVRAETELIYPVALRRGFIALRDRTF